jgi:F0F1-type ATP synthase assembly protein I
VTTFQPKRARHTTIGVRAPKGFVVKVLEPHVKAVISVFRAARTQVVTELADSWLGAEAVRVLTVDEHV